MAKSLTFTSSTYSLAKLIIIWLCVFPVIFISAQTTSSQLPRKRPTVGLALSGGGAKGFAYIGLLRVIQEAGLPIDYIWGSSIGSIIGGLYAIGYHPETIAKLIRSQDWHNLLRD